MLLNMQGIEKYYGDRLIFAFDSLKIYRGDKIGITGPNGAGKSTLLKILCGIIPPDKGKVDIRANIAYVDQLSGETAADAPKTQNVYQEQGLCGAQNLSQTQDAQQDTQQAAQDVWNIFEAKSEPKSGGEIMRKKLVAAFGSAFDILALDEPSSNLDIDGINILNAMLFEVETLLLISHDRQLLDTHCNKIIEVSDGKLSVFCGGWAEYEQAAFECKEKQKTLYKEYLREKDRLENSIKEAAQKASNMKKTPARMGNSEARLHRREVTAKQAKVLNAGRAIASRLDKIERVEKPKETQFIKTDFSLTNPPRNKIIFSCNDLNFGYGGNTTHGGDLIFKNARFEIRNGAHAAITGPNGCGKTTLLKLICERPDLIYRVPLAKIGYLSQNFSHLDPDATILQNTLSLAVQPQTVVRNVLAGMGFKADDVHKKAAVLSGGELIKVSLSRLIVSDCNVLILDEPTNYLDIDSLIQVQNALTNYEGTLLFVSHDTIFTKTVATQILKIQNKLIVEE